MLVNLPKYKMQFFKKFQVNNVKIDNYWYENEYD